MTPAARAAPVQRKAKTIPTHPVGVPSFVEDLLHGVADAPSAKTDDERFSPYAVDESLIEAFAFAEGSADTGAEGEDATTPPASDETPDPDPNT